MRLWPSLLALAAVVVLAVDSPKPASKGKPLLLLDDEPESKPSAKAGADNSRCQVCHLNLAMEQLAVTHAKAGVGCYTWGLVDGRSQTRFPWTSWVRRGTDRTPWFHELLHGDDSPYDAAEIAAFRNATQRR